MADNPNKIQIESDSTQGIFYEVDIQKLTCTCPYFKRELNSLPIDDPKRICKHLAQAFADNEIPHILIHFKDDILWCAKHKISYAAKKETIKRKKIELPEGSVKTISVDKKRKYCYIEGLISDKNIYATIPLDGGLINYKIGKYHANYDTVTQDSNVPTNYRHMENAIVNWLVSEYNNYKNESAPKAKNKTIDYEPNKTEHPENSVNTLLVHKKAGMIDFYGQLDNFEEDEYYHITGEVGRESIEAIIRKDINYILYSINGSNVYTYTYDLECEFPKSYWYIQKAVISWLKNEYVKINNQ